MDLTYLSLGAGVQSTALLVLSATGKCRRADVAIFADTGDEPARVYKHLDALRAWSPIPINVVSNGCLSDTILNRIGKSEGNRTTERRKGFSASIPAFTPGNDKDARAAPLRRQCTFEYKMEPIQAEVRRLLGYQKGERIAGKSKAVALIGISLDEATRMKPSRVSWIENTYPLVELGLRRSDCLQVIRDAGLPEPGKSSCVFCPYHADSQWLEMRKNEPEEFERAVQFDRAIRNMRRAGVSRPVFLHRTLRPLDEVEFKHENQIGMWDEECEGMCGV